MTDFMREFGGTRFLAPGGLAGIEFLPTPKIAIPADLTRRKDPLVNYNIGGRPTIEVNEIALNLLNNVTTEYFAHTHELAVPAEKYADQHPEYFALVNGQRIRQHPHPWKPGVLVKEPHLCYSNKDVQELIYQDMLRSLDAGYPEYLSLQADGFQPCTCDECKKLFDTSDWGEKLWLLNKRWAERLLKDRPGKFLVVTAYTVTGKPPAAFKDFPPNMRVSVGSYQQAFDTWKDCAIPGGFVTYLHAWGGYHLCGYLPVRTPQYAERTVRMYDQYHVKGVGLDSPPAIMWGLEGPTVYVYSRMFDDVQNQTAQQLVDEYLQAAYGPAAPPMTRLFDELHHTLEAYAEVFGVDNGTFQHYTRADGRSVRYLTWQTKLRLIGFLYPPETLTLLESHLEQAEQTAGLSDKNKLRLALVRREFDYLKSTARVVHMYNAYQTRPGKNTLGELLAEMEAREKTIMAWYDTSKRPYRPGVWVQEPIARQLAHVYRRRRILQRSLVAQWRQLLVGTRAAVHLEHRGNAQGAVAGRQEDHGEENRGPAYRSAPPNGTKFRRSSSARCPWARRLPNGRATSGSLMTRPPSTFAFPARCRRAGSRRRPCNATTAKSSPANRSPCCWRRTTIRPATSALPAA